MVGDGIFSLGLVDETCFGSSYSMILSDETVLLALRWGEVSLLRLDEMLCAERLRAEPWSRFALSPGVCGGRSML